MPLASPPASTSGSFPLIPVLIGILALLIILGIILFLVRRRRDDEQ